MPIASLTCPHCSARLKVSQSSPDQEIICPRCERTFHTDVSSENAFPPMPAPAAAAANIRVNVNVGGRREEREDEAPDKKKRKAREVDLTPVKPRSSGIGIFVLVALVIATCVGGYFLIPWKKASDDWVLAPDSGPGKRYALLVGVATYDTLSSLRFAENDMHELDAILSPAGYEIVLMTGKSGKTDAARLPTGANVRAQIAQITSKCKKGDQLLIAFAGHGIHDDGKDESFFCPSDAKATEHDTLISLKQLYDRMKESKAGAKLLLVDACRNDGKRSIQRGIDGRNTPPPPVGAATLFSCSPGEAAFETDKAGKGHGVFFHFVIEGLKGQARNKEGEVTWESLNEFVRKKVSREVPVMIGGGAKQTPHAQANIMGESTVVVRYKPKGSRSTTTTATPTPDKEPNSVGMKFVLVKAGKFTMGASRAEVSAHYPTKTGSILEFYFDSEQPHEVTLTKSYFLGIHEVTQKQYREVMGKNPSHFSKDGGAKKLPADTDSFPVDSVSWENADQFCKKLSDLPAEKKAGRSYRLPTEAEWEYACRAGTTTPYAFGTKLGDKEANFGAVSETEIEDRLGRTCKVGSYRPNAWGLYDMHGNVREWCQDLYDSKYYAKSPAIDPPGSDSQSLRSRVLRGGAWNTKEGGCRSAFRSGSSLPSTSTSVLLRGYGFRVVCVPTK